MKSFIRKSYLKELVHRRDRGRPIVLQMPITSRCNSKCKTCNIWKEKDIVDLDAEKLRKVFQDPFFSEVRSVGLNGGEFTLVPNFIDILKAVLTLPQIDSVYLISNGLFPQRLFDYLKQAKQSCDAVNVGLSFCLSVDGIGKVHDEVRGISNCFAKTKLILDRMRIDHGQFCHSMSIGCTISKHNVSRIWEVDHFLKDYPFDVEYHLAVPNKRIHTFEDANYSVLTDEYCRLLATEFFYQKYLNSESMHKKYQYFSNYYYLKNNGKERLCECGYLYRDVTIDENMDMSLCATASDTVGNLNQSSASEIYQSGKMDKMAKKVRKHCSGCIHYSYYKHTLKGRIRFMIDYIPRQYALEKYKRLSQNNGLMNEFQSRLHFLKKEILDARRLMREL